MTRCSSSTKLTVTRKNSFIAKRVKQIQYERNIAKLNVTSLTTLKSLKNPLATPINPPKTTRNSALIAGDLAANTNSKTEAIGKTDPETAHQTPRPRNES